MQPEGCGLEFFFLKNSQVPALHRLTHLTPSRKLLFLNMLSLKVVKTKDLKGAVWF
jgi:hypothetical protein